MRVCASSSARAQRGAHVGRNVGDQLGRIEPRDLGEHVFERRLAVERGRRDVTGRDVGVRQRDHVVERGDRGQVVVRRALEDVLFEQRAGRHDAHDVAPHQLVRHRRFELFGQRDDAALRDRAWRGIRRAHGTGRRPSRPGARRRPPSRSARSKARARSSRRPRRRPRRNRRPAKARSLRDSDASSRSTARASATRSAVVVIRAVTASAAGSVRARARSLWRACA